MPIERLDQDAIIAEVRARLGAAGPPTAAPPIAVSGLWGSSAPMVAAALAAHARRTMLLIAAHADHADETADDLETFSGSRPQTLPAWELTPGQGAAGDEIAAERTRLCELLREQRDTNAAPLIVAPIQALMQPVPTPAALDACGLALAVGDTRDPMQIAEWLTERNFTRLDQVEQAGDFALRGGILDIVASNAVDPVRIEFFGDQIESIRSFDLATKRSTRDLTRTRITVAPPQGDAKPGETTHFLAYLPADAIVVIHEPTEVQEFARTLLERLGSPVGMYSADAVFRHAMKFSTLLLSRFDSGAAPDESRFAARTLSLPPFEPHAADAVVQLVKLATEQPVIVYCDTEGERERLAELILQAECDDSAVQCASDTAPGMPHPVALGMPRPVAQRGAGDTDRPATAASFRTATGRERIEHENASDASSPTSHRRAKTRMPRPVAPGMPRPIAQRGAGDANTPAAAGSAKSLDLRIGVVHHGFTWANSAGTARFTVIGHHEIFHRHQRRRRMRAVTAARPIDSFLDLDEGDLVVHALHGIARYGGLKTLTRGERGRSEEFLTLQFAADAVLHVSASQIELVQKYVGPTAARPKLSVLGGTRWKAARAAVEEAVTDFAGELLRVQAEREAREGTAYPDDTHWQREFEAAFVFTETPDQLRALGEIKGDLRRVRPMDRLICGDVGYGKTELAIRAAFKVVEYGRQVAVLVPTTVLAEQHYETFRERMADYPFAIDRLSRFRSAPETRDILARAKRGQIDVLIGTHRLLSPDVHFADLGLVVVDEEQRFGVEHKERLKQLRASVDVLTLTATPIPRTLHMSMVGLRDISALETPPIDRRSIITRVAHFNRDLIREAVIRELNRDGQIYFVHNRVKSIQRMRDKLAAIVPEARIVIGHGQMPGDELEDVMLRFVRREADILLCTTIIESGIDIPTANTILIDGADMFGLADMHQLRGRVGRYKHRAYCYLLIPPDRPLTSVAARRLKAIEEFSELGSGFRIAMRDLEIRGAGNILGPEQSGHIATVGYDLYCTLLEQAVARMKGRPQPAAPEVHLELGLEAHVPKRYVAADRQRMEIYRRIAACRTVADVEQAEADIRDAYGPPPVQVQTLLAIADLRIRAVPWKVRSVVRKDPDLIFTVEDVRLADKLFAESSGSVRIIGTETIHWRVPESYFAPETMLAILRRMFAKS